MSGSTLKRAFIQGAGWTFSGQAGLFLLQIASISILARLLAPEDFGLIGLLGSVIAVLALFRELGFGVAIIQSKEVSEAQLRRVFQITFWLGCVLAVLTWVVGKAVAIFMEEPRIAHIAPFFGLCFVFNSVETVPLAILRRKLQFSRIVVRDLVVRVVALGVAISAAYWGAGYWALVAQAVTMAGFQLALSWMASGWSSRGAVAPVASVLPMLRFGAAFTGSNVANYVTQNLDSILIGKVWGVESVGYYTRARALMMAPINQALGPLGAVLMPVLSRAKDEPLRVQQWVEKLSAPMLIVSGPIAALFSVASTDIVQIILGSKWGESAKVFRWMALYLMIAPLGMLLHSVLAASGNARLLLHWTWSGALISVLSILCSVWWGIEAVAATTILSAVFLRSFIAVWCASKTGYIEIGRMTGRLSLSLAHGFLWVICLQGLWGSDFAHGLPNYGRCLLGGIIVVSGVSVAFCVTGVGKEVFGILKSGLWRC